MMKTSTPAVKYCRKGHEYAAKKGCPTCAREYRNYRYSLTTQNSDKSAGQDTENALSGTPVRLPVPHPKTGRVKGFVWNADTAKAWWARASSDTRWMVVNVKGMARHMGWPNILLDSDGNPRFNGICE